jgi:hypothetical protein
VITQLNSGKTQFTMKVIEVKIVGMGGVDVFMVGRLFIEGRVQELAHPFVEFGFKGVKATIEGFILLIKVLKFGIEGTNVVINVSNINIVLVVVDDQRNHFLVVGENHL